MLFFFFPSHPKEQVAIQVLFVCLFVCLKRHWKNIQGWLA